MIAEETNFEPLFKVRSKFEAFRNNLLDISFKNDLYDQDKMIEVLAGLELFSKLPITVDLIVWRECSDEFKKLIAKDMVKLCGL